MPAVDVTPNRCPKCGVRYPANLYVCPECREILVPPPTPARPPAWLITLLVLFILALAGYAGYLVYEVFVLRRY